MGDYLSPRQQSQGRILFIICALLFILSFALYFQSIFHGFTNYDDDWLILDNFKIRTLENTFRFFTESTETDYLPLKELSYAVNYYFNGTDPLGYHLTDVVLYALTVVFVFLFLMTLSDSCLLPVTATLIFLCHPIHAEVVNWASARKDTLSGLFFFASLYLFARYLKGGKVKKTSLYLLSLFLFLLSLFSKPSVIILPLLLFVTEISFFNDGDDGRKLFPEGIMKRIMPFAAVSVVFAILTFVTAYEKEVVKEYWEGSPYVTFLSMITVIGDYIRLVFFPFNLSVRYEIDFQRSFFSLPVILNLLFIAIILFAALKWKENKWYRFGILWFFASLLPVSNIIPIAILKADRYIYIPSLGIIVIFAFFITRLFEKERGETSLLPIKTLAYLFSLLVFILFSLLTVDRSNVWKDGMTLWQDTIKKSPGDYLVLNNMGTMYKDMKKYEKAESLFRRAIRAKPDYYAPYFNLSTLYGIYGEREEALSYIEKAFELNPGDFKTNVNLGNIYRREGRLTDAESAYRRAISIKPDAPEGYYNLAIFYEKEMGDLNEALKLYEVSIARDKTFVRAFNNIGNLYFRNGKPDDALFYYGKALEIKPGHLQSLNNIATIYLQKGKCEKAISYLKKAVQKSSDLRHIFYFNLYKAYQCSGNDKESVKYLKLSLEIKPDFAPALEALDLKK